MNIEKKTVQGVPVAVVRSDTPVITDVGSALDLLGSLWDEPRCERFAIEKAAVSEAFFDLSTRLAGEILQKFINYNIKFAVFGDFSAVASRSLRDFIYESNNGHDVFFVRTEDEALDRLAGA